MSENPTNLSENTDKNNMNSMNPGNHTISQINMRSSDDIKQEMFLFPTLNGRPREELIDVVLMFLPKYEKELVKDIKVIFKENNDIDLYELIKTLKSLGFPVDKNMISYYSYTSDVYVYCGNDPLPQDAVIPAREVAHEDDKYQVKLRIRQIVNSFTIYTDGITSETDNMKIENHDGQLAEKKQKRTKERKIGQILDKVFTWRKYYSGYTDPQTGQTIKMSLEEAAQKVGISKKSLDDYLLQIRFGKKYGFNFNDHYNDRVGVLRSFVKKHKTVVDKQGDNEGEFPSKDFANLIEKKDGRVKRNSGNAKGQNKIENADDNNNNTLNNKSKKIK